MLKTIIIIAVILGAGLAAILVYAATRPDAFRVARSASIMAPPEKIFPLISDLHQWEPWSPFDKMDPGMKRSYSGAPSGTGAVYEWDGNSKVGAGRVTIADTAPPNKVTINLDMIRPFAAHNIVEFTLEPAGDATKVTWAMHGSNPFISRVMCMFFDMDKTVGGEFETGLSDLKLIAERV